MLFVCTKKTWGPFPKNREGNEGNWEGKMRKRDIVEGKKEKENEGEKRRKGNLRWDERSGSKISYCVEPI